MPPTFGGQLKELAQHRLNLGNVLAHADQPRDLLRLGRQWPFAQVVGIQHSPVRQILHGLKVGRVSSVVAQVKRVVVHRSLTFDCGLPFATTAQHAPINVWP